MTAGPGRITGFGSDVLRVEEHGPVVVVTLHRPHAANAVDVDLARQLGRVARAAEDDPVTRAVVLTGAGDRFFCAGGDLGAIREGRGPELSYSPGGFAGFVQLDRRVPWIAAVNGLAFGGGLEIALACDIRWAVPEARFALPEVGLGLVAAAGGVLRTMGTVPASRAMELVLTGDRFDAAEALRWGMVSRLVPGPELVAQAVALAQRIAAHPAAGVAATLHLARRALAEDAQWPLADEVLAGFGTGELVRDGSR